MKGVKCIKHSCQGESHKASDKPCQDYSCAEDRSGFAMAIVSDGHGGARYFRSDKGSEIAVRCAKRAITDFVNERSNILLFENCDLTTSGVNPHDDETMSETKASDDYNCQDKTFDKKHDKIRMSLSWLVASIIRQWNNDIREDALTRDITEWERQHVESNYLEAFADSLNDPEGKLEKIYGCTLMAFVMTEYYWFAFQIGDGKMVFFNMGEHGIEDRQYIPWDDRCFLNKTTSICDSDAASEFRFAYCGDGSFPEAVFLGSDGIDDTYGDGDMLTDFYIRLYKEIATSSTKAVKKTLETDLPVISKMGSKDDMSVACVYWSEKPRIRRNALLMSQWQLSRLHQESEKSEAKRKELHEKILHLEKSEELTDKQRIELTYARNDLVRIEEALEKNERNVSTIQAFDRNLKKQELNE